MLVFTQDRLVFHNLANERKGNFFERYEEVRNTLHKDSIFMPQTPFHYFILLHRLVRESEDA